MSQTKVADINFCHLKQYRCILHGSVFISNWHLTPFKCSVPMLTRIIFKMVNQRTNGPVNAHLISWPSKAQNIQNLENIW